MGCSPSNQAQSPGLLFKAFGELIGSIDEDSIAVGSRERCRHPVAIVCYTAMGAHLNFILESRSQGIKGNIRIDDTRDGCHSGSNSRLYNGDVIHIKQEHVGAIEVADGYITCLAGIGAQINSVLVPDTLCTVAAAGRFGIHLGTRALGGHRPFLDGGEGRSNGIAGR